MNFIIIIIIIIIDIYIYRGFTDKHSWVHKFYYNDKPLLYDINYKPKPCYYGIKESLYNLYNNNNNNDLDKWDYYRTNEYNNMLLKEENKNNILINDNRKKLKIDNKNTDKPDWNL